MRSEYVYSAAGSTRPDGDRIYGEVLKRLAGLAAGATVLDAGCGNGYLTPSYPFML